MRSSGARTSCSSTVVIGRPTGIGPRSKGGGSVVTRQLYTMVTASASRTVAMRPARHEIRVALDLVDSRGARPPRRRDPIADVPVHLRPLPGSPVHVAGQLVGREAAKHRHEPVVPRHPVEAKWPGHEPEPECGEPATAEIA